MHLKIQCLAIILSGYTFREAINTDNNGGIFVLQAKDIIQGTNITETKSLTPISFCGTRTTSFLQKGDIAIVSRGTGIGSFRCVLFNLSNANVIASSSVLILRLKKSSVLAGYVTLYLNSAIGQNKIFQATTGAYIQAVSRKNLEEIEIPVPSMQKQLSLIALEENMRHQEKLSEKKRILRQGIFNTVIKNLSI